MTDSDTSPCAPDSALADLARGDLDASGLWVAHIDACPSCRARFEALLDRTAALGGAGSGPPPTDTFNAATAEELQDGRARVLGGARAEAARCLRPPQGADELGRLGPYRVLDVLGAGGMGLVLHAEDPALGRHVALKILRPHLAADPAARARFRREAQAMAAVVDDHVVPVHAVGTDGDVPFVAMPLLTGETLAAALQRAGRLAPARVTELGRQVALGLAAAHACGLVHRDVTPANVWLEPRPGGGERVRLLDFGLARAVASTDVTRTGAIIGTPAYMSPEQARGQPADHRTDLFSLGAVLYRAATGTAPFTGEDAFAVARQVVDTDPPPLARLAPDLPPGLAELIRRLLRKDPAARPASAQAVADELVRIAAGQPAARARRRRYLLVGAAVAAGVLLVVVVLARLHRGGVAGGPEAAPARALTLVGATDPAFRHTNVYAVALARTDAGPVVLSEGFPEGAEGRGVRVWTPDLEPAGTLPTTGDYIRGLAPTPDGQRFVTVGGGGLEVWVLAGTSARRVVKPAPPPAGIGGIVVAPDGDHVYTTDYEDGGLVRAYVLADTSLRPAGPLPEPLGLPRHLAVAPDGRWVGAAAKSGKVCLWDLRAAGGPAAFVLRATGRPVAVVAFAPDGRRVWVVDGTASGEAFDLTGARPQPAGAVPTALAGGPPVAAFPSADGARLVVVGERAIQVLDVSAVPARPLGTFEVPTPVRTAAFDAPAGRLYTGHVDGLRLWVLAGP
jgi:Protein kinase domain